MTFGMHVEAAKADYKRIGVKVEFFWTLVVKSGAEIISKTTFFHVLLCLHVS